MNRQNHDFKSPAGADASQPLIVHVVRQFLPNRGGLEDVVYNLCRQALRQGYRVRVVTLNSLFSDPDKMLSDKAEIDGIEVVRIPWKGSSRYPVAPSVLKHIGDANLVHVHAIDFFFDFLALTKPWHRRKMIATTHGGFFHTRRFAALKALWFRTLTRYSASRYNFVVGCSRADMATFRPISATNLTLIENGVDTAKFRDKASRAPAKRVITIGRFSANKRLDRLVDTMLALQGIDPDWSLDIIGVASDYKTADIEAMTARLNGKGHVHTGPPDQEIGKLMSSASLFASASEYEGFGLVAIEAMSAGLLPVLEGNTAYQALAETHPMMRIADFSNPDASAQALLSAWHDLNADPAATRDSLVQAAEDYSWDRVAKRYFSFYRDILG